MASEYTFGQRYRRGGTCGLSSYNSTYSPGNTDLETTELSTLPIIDTANSDVASEFCLQTERDARLIMFKNSRRDYNQPDR
jgi:hypothetical protein